MSWVGIQIHFHSEELTFFVFLGESFVSEWLYLPLPEFLS
jgi:hypothetical protein